MKGSVEHLAASQGGVPKRRIDRARIGSLGIEGDAVAHPRVHGGPDRALCIYSIECIDALRAEGHEVAPGALGENLTTRGIDFGRLVAGDRVRVGRDVELEITRYTTPCNTIAHCFVDRDFMRIAHDRHPGWSRLYARVTSAGTARIGDDVQHVRGHQTRLS